MIKDILQQLAPLDEKIAALRGDPADENMTDITNHAAELAELSAQEDALLSGCGALTAEDRVFLARHPERPHIDEIVDALFTDFFEQCGDRQCKEDAAILGGVALFHGQPVTVIGHRKGSTLEENLRCNFGMPGPEGYRKALRLMKQAEKFDRPIITFIDTPGAYPGKDAEERGQGEAIARNLMEMSGLTVPVIAVVTGEGSSGGALALGVANRILMLEKRRLLGAEPRRLCQHPVEGFLPQRRSLRDHEADRTGSVQGTASWRRSSRSRWAAHSAPTGVLLRQSGRGTAAAAAQPCPHERPSAGRAALPEIPSDRRNEKA